MAGGRGSIRLKREPDYWEVRAYAGRDPGTGRHRYVSRTVRGGKRDAQRLLTTLTTELQTHGPTDRRTVNELLTAHVDHLEARGRQARTIEGYRTIARGVEADSLLGTTSMDKITVKAIDDFYNRLGEPWPVPGHRWSLPRPPSLGVQASHGMGMDNHKPRPAGHSTVGA